MKLANIHLVLVVLSAATAAAFGQWSADPGENLAIADRPGEQTQPKIQPTSDGGCYVSWFDNANGGYDVFLQRLDAAGIEQWTHNGILIADRGFSSTQNYDLRVDADDYALLTFRDDRFADVQITATRISPGGVAVWGPTGVQLTADNAFKAAPRITPTSDGSIVVGWTRDNQARFQKLDPAGAPQWPGPLIVSDPGDDILLSDLNRADGGSVIASWIQTANFSSPKHLHARKLSPDGALDWPSAAVVFDSGSLQFGNFPPFLPDGAGGAVFGWYGVSPLQCYVQRLDAAGNEVFPSNGVPASTLATQLRVSPSASYRAVDQELFLFWVELNSMQSQHGVYGQKFSAAGLRQWGDSGVVVVPVGPIEESQVRTVQIGDGAVVLWVETLAAGNQRVKAARLDGDATFVWDHPTILAASSASGKSRLEVTAGPAESILLAWVDTRADSGDVYVQNLSSAGDLGVLPCPTDLNGDGTTNAADLALMLGAWGPNPGNIADLNADGLVNAADLALLLGAWGPCP